MEVATIITSSKEVISLFDKFIYSYKLMRLTGKDHDMARFESILNHKIILYYHFELNDPEEEFSYNYSEGEVETIREYYGSSPFFMFDLSYRTEALLTELLSSFYVFLIDNAVSPSDILISHPFDGLIKFEETYKVSTHLSARSQRVILQFVRRLKRYFRR